MAAEGTAAPAGAAAVEVAPQTDKPNPPPPTTKAPTATTADAPKLTPAQMKAKAKAEKAARRAQAKEVKAAVAAAQPPSGTPGADAKGGKTKGKQDGSQASGPQSQGKLSLVHRPSISGRRPSIFVEKDIRSSIPECFSHIPMAKRIPMSQAHKDVHPAVLAAGQQMSTFAIKDSISRLEATLQAFKKVSKAYTEEMKCNGSSNPRLSNRMRHQRGTPSRDILFHTS